ncbi:DUF5362 family protein [Niastella sp. OAS944]|uniref:DUF5362 family protein n=1 Tax=Niastella sp. OAS944 TaxID=2664089 RepID=UPI0034880BF8|nr:magnesium-transporting ATPase (P-type) [Chitinophagaceae bacterium OAS944]
MEQYVQTAPDNSESSLFELEIDHELSGTLTNIAKWGKFIGIAGFIITGLFLIIILLLGKMFSALSPLGSYVSAGGAAATIIYVIIAAMFFFPSLFVFNFSRKVHYALRNTDQQALNNAFANLKIRFMITGIFWIVLFAFWLLAIFRSM